MKGQPCSLWNGVKSPGRCLKKNLGILQITLQQYRSTTAHPPSLCQRPLAAPHVLHATAIFLLSVHGGAHIARLMPGRPATKLKIFEKYPPALVIMSGAEKPRFAIGRHVRRSTQQSTYVNSLHCRSKRPFFARKKYSDYTARCDRNVPA